jgi:hypothetical protein
VHDDVIGRIQKLPLPLISEHGGLAVMLVPHDAAAAVLAGELAALVIESIAVAVMSRLAEVADVAVLFEPAQLAVVGNVAPDQVLAFAAPGWPFGPQHSGMDALDGGVANLVFGEALVEDDDVRVGIARGILAAPVALCVGGCGQQRGGSQEGAAIHVRFHRALEEELWYQTEEGANNTGSV